MIAVTLFRLFTFLFRYWVLFKMLLERAKKKRKNVEESRHTYARTTRVYCNQGVIFLFPLGTVCERVFQTTKNADL